MFEAFPKMPRLSRLCVISEKIDGTNAQVYIDYHSLMGDPSAWQDVAIAEQGGLVMLAGSRSRYITPEADNFGFARWVKANAEDLFSLGVGRHFGEWWGQGIQRDYGLTEKRFSLFNTARWADDRDIEKYPQGRPACCHVVPVLNRCMFDMGKVDAALYYLQTVGSAAVPGFLKPEGVVVFHEAAGIGFKKTIERDDEPKGAPR